MVREPLYVQYLDLSAAAVQYHTKLVKTFVECAIYEYMLVFDLGFDHEVRGRIGSGFGTFQDQRFVTNVNVLDWQTPSYIYYRQPIVSAVQPIVSLEAARQR